MAVGKDQLPLGNLNTQS